MNVDEPQLPANPLNFWQVWRKFAVRDVFRNRADQQIRLLRRGLNMPPQTSLSHKPNVRLAKVNLP